MSYDAENRLVSVSGASTATFVYDGDGNRVKRTVNGTTKTYIGNYYEWMNDTTPAKKYYYAGAQRIAMREGSKRYLILSDHLGSTYKIRDFAAPNNVEEIRYKAWGQRFGPADPTTNRLFTGQLREKLLGGSEGLYFFGSRWVDVSLGRFTQADTLIPEASQGTQAWDRYAYSSNNPINYNDPSGHCAISPSAISGSVIGFVGSCIKDLADAYDAYQAGETRPAILYLEATGLIDVLVSTANNVQQMNSDVRTVFSNAPLEERILPSIRVGTFAVGTAATFVGAGQLAVQGVSSSFAGKGINANEFGPASSYANKVLLQKQLASQQQMGETGFSLSGAGTKTPLRDASRLANQYGGNPSDWAKMGSSSYTAWDGIQFETHWYKNLSTGFSTEFKVSFTAIVKYIVGISIK